MKKSLFFNYINTYNILYDILLPGCYALNYLFHAVFIYKLFSTIYLTLKFVISSNLQHSYV